MNILSTFINRSNILLRKQKRLSGLFVLTLLFSFTLLSSFSFTYAQLQGTKEAVALAQEMLEMLGGKKIWESARTVNIQLEGHYAVEQEPWVEKFWIDLEVPRGRYEITSGSSNRVIAWTNKGGWEERDGVLEEYSKERLDLDKSYWRKEPNVIFHRLARGIPATLILLDSTDANLRRIRIIDIAKNDTLCWFAVNLKSEPVKWSTFINKNLFEHVLGPLGEYDDIRLPKWGGTIGGVWRYEHTAASISKYPPAVSFEAPAKKED